VRIAISSNFNLDNSWLLAYFVPDHGPNLEQQFREQSEAGSLLGLYRHATVAPGIVLHIWHLVDVGAYFAITGLELHMKLSVPMQ
jgi:hypothetical protein